MPYQEIRRYTCVNVWFDFLDIDKSLPTSKLSENFCSIKFPEIFTDSDFLEFMFVPQFS
jgi:hypothetical protein